MQAAALLQVSRRTIYNRIRDGQLATIRIHGSQRVLTSSLFGTDSRRRCPQTSPTAQRLSLRSHRSLPMTHCHARLLPVRVVLAVVSLPPTPPPRDGARACRKTWRRRSHGRYRRHLGDRRPQPARGCGWQRRHGLRVTQVAGRGRRARRAGRRPGRVGADAER